VSELSRDTKNKIKNTYKDHQFYFHRKSWCLCRPKF